MKRGRKPDLPSTKMLRGTTRPYRDAHKVEIIEPDSVPQRPSWLSAEAAEVWDEDLPRVLQIHTVSELDTTLFSNYCVLQGAIVAATKAGSIAPVGAFIEVRKMQELLGIGGSRSRLDVARPKKAANPFVDL